LPNDQKNVLGLIRNLGIGAYWARQIVTILQTFEGAGFATPTVALRSIVSESYGHYSPYDERSARRERPLTEEPSYPPERRRERRREEAKPEERYEEEREPRAAQRYSRETEMPRERSRPKPSRERPGKEPERAPQEVQSDLVGRRCLFHGGIAVARCSKCKAVLCKECIRGSDRCPRCNTPLRAVEEAGDKSRSRGREPEEELEEEIEQEPERPSRRYREPQKPSRKKSDEDDDLTRL